MNSESSASRLLDNIPLVVVVLLVVDSLHFIFAGLLRDYLPPTVAALYVLSIATAQVALYMGWRERIRLDILWRHRWFFIAIGFLVAASTALNYTSVNFINPGIASMVGKTSVIFSLAFGLFWLRESLTGWQKVGIGLAIVGVFTVSYEPGNYLQLGAVMVLASAFSYSLHAALVKRYSAEMRLTDFFLFRLMMTTAFLLLFVLSRGELMLPPNGWAWLILLVAATVDVTVSRSLYYLVLRRLNLSVHAIILTLSPVMAIGWALLLFTEWPTLQQFLGGTGILMGVLLVTLGREKAPRYRETEQVASKAQ